MFDHPTLPQNDPSPATRDDQLRTARNTYNYSYKWPPNVAVAAVVPERDSYSPMYIAALLPSAWEIFKNTLSLIDVIQERQGLEDFFKEEGHRVPQLKAGAIGDWYLRVANDLAKYVATKSGESVAGYNLLYGSLGAPSVSDRWQDDRTFAWQRIAGVNPMTLARITAIPPNIAIGEAEFTKAIGKGTLAAAFAEGRVFACDYTFLEGAITGVTFDRPKYLPAPYAVFAAIDGKLRPVAIQIGATRGAQVATPADGNTWKVCKLAVQVADANHHETITHLGRTHLVMEAVALALKRQLAENHPLHHLIWPHCEYTFPINNSAATNLIAAGGAIDFAFAGTIETSASFVKVGMDSFDLMHAGVPTEIRARGVDDTEVLPEYPYRDDALPVYGAIRRWVDAYVRAFYVNDDGVAADTELAAFVDELGSQEGGRLKGITKITTAEDLVRLVSNIVWISSGQHAAVNFTQYPYMGYVPNMVGAFWSEWPPKDIGHDDTYACLLPPYNVAVLQLHTVYQLSAIRVNHLGHYGLLYFSEGNVRDAASAFKKELEAIEAELRGRDPARYMSYPHLFPSNIPQSIHI